jgi:DNA-directed RNA polymerase alpha subunit
MIWIEDAGFSPQVSTALKRQGLKTLDDIAALSSKELLLLRRIHHERLAEIRRILAVHGLAIRKDD